MLKENHTIQESLRLECQKDCRWITPSERVIHYHDEKYCYAYHKAGWARIRVLRLRGEESIVWEDYNQPLAWLLAVRKWSTLG